MMKGGSMGSRPVEKVDFNVAKNPLNGNIGSEGKLSPETHVHGFPMLFISLTTVLNGVDSRAKIKIRMMLSEKSDSTVCMLRVLDRWQSQVLLVYPSILPALFGASTSGTIWGETVLLLRALNHLHGQEKVGAMDS